MTLAAAAALALAVLAVPPVICRLLGGGPPDPGPKLAALAPLATAPAVAAVGVAATCAWWLALVLAVPAGTLVSWQLPPLRRSAVTGSRGRERPGTRSGPPGLRLLTLNMRCGQASAEHVVRCLREHRVDVLAAQELTEDMAARLVTAGIGRLLPFSQLEARPGSAGGGIWSRWPARPQPAVQGLACAAPRAMVMLGGHRQVLVTAVHVMSPHRSASRRWHHELGLLGTALAGAPGPQLVAGDFNASRDHRSFRHLLRAGFVDSADCARSRRWPAFTWPAGRRVPLMRLDHVLATRAEFVVRESRTVRIPGTDHRGVLAVVALRR